MGYDIDCDSMVGEDGWLYRGFGIGYFGFF